MTKRKNRSLLFGLLVISGLVSACVSTGRAQSEHPNPNARHQANQEAARAAAQQAGSPGSVAFVRRFRDALVAAYTPGRAALRGTDATQPIDNGLPANDTQRPYTNAMLID